MSVGSVARGGLFLFIGLVVGSVFGYIFWFLISVFSGAEVVGIASSIDSLSTLVTGIAILGLPSGVQRFLGYEFSRRNTNNLNAYFWSSLTLTAAMCALSAMTIWTLAFLDLPLMGFSQSMLATTGLLTLLGFSAIFSAFFASIVRTGYIAIAFVVAGITKLALGVLLVYLGFGWVGAVMAIIVGGLTMVALMLSFALRELKRLGGVRIGFSFVALQESLHAGFATWLPGVVALVGQQLSLLIVFGLQGGLEAGTYYIAYAIFSIIYLLPGSFMSILFPILSGLTSDRGKVAWKVLKFCLALACPSAAFLIFYAALPLSLMGGNYVGAAPTLSLLTMSLVPLIFISAISNLVYAAGSYGKVLGIGLAVNVPRVILYLYLIPIYGGFGAALSSLLGTIVGLAIALYLSKGTEFQVSSRSITVTVAAPFLAASFCFLTRLVWFIGGIIILVTSVLCYGRSGVIERSELGEIARAFASEKTIARAGERFNWLLRIIYGE